MITLNKFHLSEEDIKNENILILKAQANPKDFAPLYDYYFLPIFRYVLKRLENEEDAGELTTDIFAKALFKINQFKSKGFPFSSWLFQIARNEIIDFYRKNQASKYIRVSDNELKYLVDGSEENLELALNKEIQIKEVLSSLKLLKDEELELIELRYFEDRSFKEIAEILNSNETNIRVKTHRVIAKLKTILKTNDHE